MTLLTLQSKGRGFSQKRIVTKLSKKYKHQKEAAQNNGYQQKKKSIKL
jgi:hypothetical protein